MDRSSILPIMVIDLEKLKNNYKLLLKYTKESHLGAVIKGNGYGLGRRESAIALFEAGCRYFFIADWQEVYDLPENIVNNSLIYAMAGVEEYDFTEVVKHKVIPVFHRIDQIESWAKKYGKSRSCSIHVRMSLNRLGIQPEDLEQIYNKVDIDLLINQLTWGYVKDHESNAIECDLMRKLKSKFNVKISIAASCSFILEDLALKEAHVIRAGRCLYGAIPTNLNDHNVFKQLSPVASLYSVLIDKRELRKGEHVGYNNGFTAERDMVIGILNIGYSSGYIHGHPAQQVYANNNYCRIVSQSMDFTVIDITNCESKIGDSFELFGDHISQDDPNRCKIIIPGLITRQYLY